MACGQRCVDSKNSQTTPATTSTSSIRQLLGAADAQTARHATFSTATNYWAPRTPKRHQQEHRPQRPTQSSDPTQHAKGRTGDCPKGTTTKRNVTQGGALWGGGVGGVGHLGSRHGNAAKRPEGGGGAWAAETGKRPPQQPAQPQYANYWTPLTHKRHPPQPEQPRHTNHWAPRTRKRHQQEHRPHRPTKRSNPTQHAKGRTGDCPGPRNVTQGDEGGGVPATPLNQAPQGAYKRSRNKHTR